MATRQEGVDSWTIESHNSRTPVIALLAVVIILGAAFGFYYFQSSGAITSLNQTITSQSSQISTQASQLAAQAQQIATDEARISTLNSSVASLQAQVSSLRSQVSVDQARVTLLTTKDTQANQTIASLNSETSSLNSQIATLNSEVSSDTSQISSLQSQVASLQAISDLSESTQEIASQTYSTGTTGSVEVTSFTANYAGYVLVSMSSASDYANMGPEVAISYASSVQGNYNGIYIPAQGYFEPFSSVPDSMAIPITPGTVTVYLLTSDTTAQTATLSVVYYY